MSLLYTIDILDLLSLWRGAAYEKGSLYGAKVEDVALSYGHWIVTKIDAIFKVQMLESWMIQSVPHNQREHLHSEGKRRSNFGKQEINLSKDSPGRTFRTWNGLW